MSNLPTGVTSNSNPKPVGFVPVRPAVAAAAPPFPGGGDRVAPPFPTGGARVAPSCSQPVIPPYVPPVASQEAKRPSPAAPQSVPYQPSNSPPPPPASPLPVVPQPRFVRQEVSALQQQRSQTVQTILKYGTNEVGSARHRYPFNGTQADEMRVIEALLDKLSECDQQSSGMDEASAINLYTRSVISVLESPDFAHIKDREGLKQVATKTILYAAENDSVPYWSYAQNITKRINGTALSNPLASFDLSPAAPLPVVPQPRFVRQDVSALQQQRTETVQAILKYGAGAWDSAASVQYQFKGIQADEIRVIEALLDTLSGCNQQSPGMAEASAIALYAQAMIAVLQRPDFAHIKDREGLKNIARKTILYTGEADFSVPYFNYAINISKSIKAATLSNPSASFDLLPDPSAELVTY